MTELHVDLTYSEHCGASALAAAATALARPDCAPAGLFSSLSVPSEGCPALETSDEFVRRRVARAPLAPLPASLASSPVVGPRMARLLRGMVTCGALVTATFARQVLDPHLQRSQSELVLALEDAAIIERVRIACSRTGEMRHVCRVKF